MTIVKFLLLRTLDLCLERKGPGLYWFILLGVEIASSLFIAGKELLLSWMEFLVLEKWSLVKFSLHHTLQKEIELQAAPFSDMGFLPLLHFLASADISIVLYSIQEN